MHDSTHMPSVGSQDPELRSSPVAEEGDEDTEVLRQQVPGDAECHFNDLAYPNGTYVRSGGAVLRCDRGLWIPAGSADSDHS